MDKFDKETRSLIMSKVKSKDSKIELALRKLLTEKGLKFKKNSSKHFGKPDIVFASKKVAIFLDSCFWHGCGRHCRIPATNKKFWQEKISRNKKRDATVNKEYKKMGWVTMRVWEHELMKDGQKVVLKILLALDKKNKK
ncbi:MAG: very short patch repair endonuclease [Candidatus Paceibacterota bacterium]|jgi:DNA mismatch endonuclease (patch repair protein)